MRVTEIIFSEPGKVRLVVEIPETEALHTAQAPHMPRILFRMFPYLAAQRCRNDLGVSFRREALSTEIPHLFEHLLLEIQKQVHRGVDSAMQGETEWNWTIDPRGRFHVTVGYSNEIVVLACIRLSERIINALDGKEITAIDIDREIRRIRHISKLSRHSVHSARVILASELVADDARSESMDNVDNANHFSSE
jgi:hypothetical protein